MTIIQNSVGHFLAMVTEKWVVRFGPVRTEDGKDASDIDFDHLEARKCLGSFEETLGWIEEVHVVCESEDEAYKVFGQILGDDCPTRLNPYQGSYSC